MKKEETLLEIKHMESDVRRMKEAAQAERERILRDARKEALELQERLRREADDRAAAILRNAEADLAHERDAILAKGRQEGEVVKAAGMANIDRAVEAVIARFQGALDA